MNQHQAQKSTVQFSDPLQLNNPVDNLVQNFKLYAKSNGNLLQKFDEEFYLTYFDKSTIQRTFAKLESQDDHKKQLNLEQFIRHFLNFIHHQTHETIFLAISLRNLYIKIRQETNNSFGIRFSDFTSFLCERIGKKNIDLIAPLKQIPEQKLVPDLQKIRQIDLNPPQIIKNSDSSLPRIAKQKKKKDKKLQQKKPVSQLFYNSNVQQIIAIGRLSSCIYFYDLDLNKQKTQINPKTFKDMTKEIAILSIGFDQANQRIGAIIKGIGIAFWEASDNFETQKTIAKSQGDQIYYLKLFKQWVTSDKNTIYFWDIKEESVTKTILNQESVLINDVCEINHLRCVCVSYTTSTERKPFILYKDTKQITSYEMGNPGCHTLHYNVPSQMLITAGYHSQLEVFELENGTYSINLKKQLKGHSSIVTCVTDIETTNYILSGDDSGEIRIWQLNYMRCLQVVKVSKYLSSIICTEQNVVFSDSRLNVMKMDKFSLPNINDEEVIHHFYDEEKVMNFFVTRKSFRKVNLFSGRVQTIFIVCSDEEEISFVLRISSGIVIGTSKGFIKLFSCEGKLKWQLSAHQGQINSIKYDRKTRFIFTLGADSKLMIWPEKAIQKEGVKKIINFKSKSFNLLTLFEEVRLLFLASNEEPQICVWDYENLKLLTVIKLDSPTNFIEINHLWRVLMVSTVQDEICLIKLVWKSSGLGFQVVYYGDSLFSGIINDKNRNFRRSEDQDKIAENCQKVESQFSKKKINPSTKLFISKRLVKINETGKSDDLALKSEGLAINFRIDNQNSSEQTKTPDKIINHALSIKLIEHEGDQKPKEKTQSLLYPFKTLKKSDNQITSRMEMKQHQGMVFLILGNTKGQIFCFNVSQLIEDHFKDQENLHKNDSPHAYRPAREDYDQELTKKKYLTLHLASIPKISNLKKNYFKLIWKSNCSKKNPVSCLSFVEMKKIYVCVSTIDGYCKYFDLKTGSIKGSLKINLPLPIKWSIQVQQDLYIKNNLYQTLIILDNILTNHGFQMLSKEYKAINVTQLFQSLTKKDTIKVERISQKTKSSLRKNSPQEKVILLQDEYSFEDMKKMYLGLKQTNHQDTLKALEAYKRVKQIKDQMSIKLNKTDEQNVGDDIKNISNQVLKQKEEVQKLLSVNYFAKLAENGSSVKLSRSADLGSLDQKTSLLLNRVKTIKKNDCKNKTQKNTSTQSKRKPDLPPFVGTRSRSQIDCKTGEQVAKQKTTLVEKLNSSLSAIMPPIKQKHTETYNFGKLSKVDILFKYALQPMPMIKSKFININRLKNEEIKGTDKENKIIPQNLQNRQHIQQMSAKEVLKQINQKLQKYKQLTAIKHKL